VVTNFELLIFQRFEIHKNGKLDLGHVLPCPMGENLINIIQQLQLD
jgi:hypothetical protein